MINAGNVCSFTGRIVKKIIKRQSDGRQVLNLVLAVPKYYNKKNKEFESSFPLLKCFGSDAEHYAEHLEKKQYISAVCRYISRWDPEKKQDYDYFEIDDIRYGPKYRGDKNND